MAAIYATYLSAYLLAGSLIASAVCIVVYMRTEEDSYFEGGRRLYYLASLVFAPVTAVCAILSVIKIIAGR